MGFINIVGKKRGGLVDVEAASDGDWVNSNFYGTDTKIYYGHNAVGTYNSFLFFTGITIPSGVTLKSAVIRIYVDTKTGSPTGYVAFNDTATPTAPTTAAQAEGKTETTAYTDYAPASTGWKDIDVLAVINELLASYSSYSADAMLALLRGAGSGTNIAYHRASEYGSYTPRLIITW